ncbi:MAG: hypothetical protein ACYS80_27080, partial [Planctomycetota bacterium]
MNKKLILLLSICMVTLFFVVARIELSIGKESDNKGLRKTAGNKALETQLVDANRLYHYVNNQGAWGTHNSPPGHATEWPGNSGSVVNYASGIWFGGL